MNGQEFAAYMPPTALVATIVSAWSAFCYDDPTRYVLQTCWRQLLRMRDADEAIELIKSALGDSVVAFLEVVS